MKTKVSPTLIGLFVLGAFALALIALYAFGDVHLFNKPQRFVVYFEESIHGLDLGSPVKLQGVRVGRVVSLNVRYSSKTNQPVVAVECELSKNVIFSDTGDRLDVAEKGQMEKLVERGMRARLGVLSLATGLLFVELDFYDPSQYPLSSSLAIPAMPLSDKALLVVPAVPSAISEFQASISEILSNVRKVNFAGLAVDVHGLLQDTRKQVNGLDLAALNAEWMKAGQSVTALVSSAEIKQTIVNLNVAIEQLTRTLAKIDSQVQPTSQELAKTLGDAQQSLRAFNEAAVAARNFISAQSGLGEETARTMSQLGDAAASVQRLADFIERNPNALITGKNRRVEPSCNNFSNTMRHQSLFTRMHFAAGLALVVGLIWGGCSVIPPPTPDPTRYYLLTEESGASPPPAVSTGSFHLGIRSVDAPGYLRTNRSMVIRRGVNELRYEDFARWVEPIDAAVQRVVRDRLLASESVATADAAPFPAATKRDFDVAIRILRCEGALDAQGKSSAQFSARYEILDPSKGGEVIARRIFVAPAASWDGTNYAQLAQSLAEAAAGLGDDIVKNLPLAK